MSGAHQGNSNTTPVIVLEKKMKSKNWQVAESDLIIRDLFTQLRDPRGHREVLSASGIPPSAPLLGWTSSCLRLHWECISGIH